MGTAGYTCRFRATGSVVGALQGVGNPPSATSGTGGSGALGRLEQPPMLEDGVAVGHSGDVVSHRASATGGSMLGLRLHRLIAMLSRHETQDRKSTRLNSSHRCISYAVFCLKKKRIELHSVHAA